MSGIGYVCFRWFLTLSYSWCVCVSGTSGLLWGVPPTIVKLDLHVWDFAFVLGSTSMLAIAMGVVDMNEDDE